MIRLALPLLLAMIAGLAANTAQAATTGTITFRGQIDAGTCSLAVGDRNRTITLPTVKVSDFDASPAVGGVLFDLTADCESDIRNVYFLFTGTPSIINGALFANTGTSVGAALELTHAHVAYIPANGTPAQRTRQIATSGGKAVIPMGANYRKIGAVTRGTLISAVTISITYN